MLHRMCITAALVLAFGMSGIPKAESSTGESSQGCNTATAMRSKNSSWFNTPLYRFDIVVHWCWQGSKITSVTTACFNEYSDSTTITYSGCSVVMAWYYEWKSSSKGGYYALAQGSYGNCFADVYCTKHFNPTVKIWVNAGGSWTSDPIMKEASKNANV